MQNRLVPGTPEYVRLYHLAFEQFGAFALWSSRPVPIRRPMML